MLKRTWAAIIEDRARYPRRGYVVVSTVTDKVLASRATVDEAIATYWEMRADRTDLKIVDGYGANYTPAIPEVGSGDAASSGTSPPSA